MMSNDGQMTIILGGIGFEVSGLKETGDMKLQQAYATGEYPGIMEEDFDNNAKVISFVIF